MKKIVTLGFVAAMAAGVASQDAPQPPKPTKEHEWLQQLVGEWDSEGEAVLEPGKPPIKTKGSESGRSLGGFWIQCENKGDFLGTPFTGLLTIGYDVDRKKYVGTWVDSMTSVLWKYEGAVDATGKILTLETEGPADVPGKLAKFREAIEVKSKDHKVFRSEIEKDGKWITHLTMNYHRKK